MASRAPCPGHTWALHALYTYRDHFRIFGPYASDQRSTGIYLNDLNVSGHGSSIKVVLCGLCLWAHQSDVPGGPTPEPTSRQRRFFPCRLSLSTFTSFHPSTKPFIHQYSSLECATRRLLYWPCHDHSCNCRWLWSCVSTLSQAS
jgi:hypothetical protein